MSGNLFELFTTQFSTNLELLLQQKGSVMRGLVAEGAHIGKMASPINQIGPVQMKPPAGRFAPLDHQDPSFVRRWVFPQDGEIVQLIDTFDKLRTLVDPQAAEVQSAADAIGRGWDDAILAAAFGTNYVGTDASNLTAETFDTTKFQISDTFGGTQSTGLTVAKMIEAKRILRHYHNDLSADPPTMVITSKQESDLLNQVQFVSTEFNDHPVLVDGNIQRFMGFNIVCSERLPMNAGQTLRQVLVFVRSGMYLGIWKDMVNRITIRDDLSSQPYQLYSAVSFGATRTQPGKVLQILCADTTGPDITP